MTFSSTFWCSFFALLVTVSHGETTLSDLSGVWRGLFINAATPVLTPRGLGVVCIKNLPQECRDQLSLVEDTYTFNGTTLSLEVRDRIGIATREQSAEATPACAKYGIYPVETSISIPTSQILSYDSNAERILYVDPRRPDDINCLPVKYRIGEQGPYLEITHAISYQGLLLDVTSNGYTFSCEFQPCFMEFNAKTGMLNGGVTNIFNVTCIAGDCLNVATALAPSASHRSNESPVDV